MDLHWSSVSQEHPNPGMHTLPGSQGDSDGRLALHSQRPVVLLHVSALSSQSVVAFKHEHGGCRGSAVVFRHVRFSGQGSNVGKLKLHSHLGGLTVLLQVSAVSPKQSVVAFKHEHAG